MASFQPSAVSPSIPFFLAFLDCLSLEVERAVAQLKYQGKPNQAGQPGSAQLSSPIVCTNIIFSCFSPFSYVEYVEALRVLSTAESISIILA